ncbi:hypothetical protein GGI25_005747 [Coemansia spiralis]|uniref:Fanconi Anaemia group E protein C-terminal domain-containing protein n=2 Tax=Coemansia TaxID=4863 RepID=A0A9W8KVF7_9FUNG|nr:hypothetical protein EDC05_005198 [Coemansia umbellata]KAJ2623416.1 hypothetical protein GGI26_002454 [Coemansia sp. RSA 1358]KAJ2670695.1 hypothetical protein GGI25_005747 [Coemansia spiralis]
MSTIGRGDDTILSRLRRQLQLHSSSQKNNDASNTNTQYNYNNSSSSSNDWAIALLHSLSQSESPDFTSVSEVWQLPHSSLAKLCQKHLNLNGYSSPTLVAYIDAVVSSQKISLENQLLLLRYAAFSKWFTDEQEAIPSIIQSQVTNLLQSYPQVIAKGFLLTLLEEPARLLPSSTAMIVKIIKADIPASALEIVCTGLAVIAKEKALAVNDNTFQVMEAVVSTVSLPSIIERISLSGWCRAWVEMLQEVVPNSCESKKLSTLMLHFVNKFGSELDSAGLDTLAALASMIKTPLKAPIISTIARKKRNKSTEN